MKNNNNLFTEFEAKFYPVNKDEYRERLRKIGAVLVTPERKMRRAIVDSDAYPQLNCHYIRVRDEGDSVRLSAKTHARIGGNIDDQKEIDVKVSGSYKKAEITIDTWPGLDTYSEIEANSEAEVKKIALILDLDWEKRIITGIKEVYMAVYGMKIEDVTEKICYITFENNPFDGIPKAETTIK